jgi:hypothetical protein
MFTISGPESNHLLNAGGIFVGLLFHKSRLVERENERLQAKPHQHRWCASAGEYFWNTGVKITHPVFQTSTPSAPGMVDPRGARYRRWRYTSK